MRILIDPRLDALEGLDRCLLRKKDEEEDETRKQPHLMP